MGRRASGVRKERRHIHLTIGYWQKLEELYGANRITPSSVIDKLVSYHLKRVEEKIALKARDMNRVADLELEEETSDE